VTIFIIFPQLLQHVAVEVGTMNGCMANRARLILRRLVMKIWCSRSSAKGGSGMTLQAKDVEVAGFYQARIRGAVWRMTNHATLGLNWLVLENERSLFVGVAGIANRIARRRRAQLLADESAVGVMTIGTLDESLFDTMVEGHVKLRLRLLMA